MTLRRDSQRDVGYFGKFPTLGSITEQTTKQSCRAAAYRHDIGWNFPNPNTTIHSMIPVFSDSEPHESRQLGRENDSISEYSLPLSRWYIRSAL
jgi:hypothetical protein